MYFSMELLSHDFPMLLSHASPPARCGSSGFAYPEEKKLFLPQRIFTYHMPHDRGAELVFWRYELFSCLHVR
jgi:hypothetical protein